MFIPWVIEFDKRMLSTNLGKTTVLMRFRASALAAFRGEIGAVCGLFEPSIQ
jgi:hypothetical protein